MHAVIVFEPWSGRGDDPHVLHAFQRGVEEGPEPDIRLKPEEQVRNMEIVELEFGLHRREAEIYTVELRIQQAG